MDNIEPPAAAPADLFNEKENDLTSLLEICSDKFLWDIVPENLRNRERSFNINLNAF